MRTSLPTIDEISHAIMQNQPQLAEQLALEYLGNASGDESVLTLLGMSLQAQDRLPEAAAVFRELTHLFPRSGLHWNNFGTILREDAQVEKADNAYRTGLALDPESIDILVNLGFLWQAQNDYAAARTYFLRACEIDPTLVVAHIYGAKACAECTDMESATRLIAAWQQWTQLTLQQQLVLASVFTSIGRTSEAETVLLRVLQTTSEKVPVQARLILLYERLNRIEEAAALLRLLPLAETISDLDLRSEIINAHTLIAARENDFDKVRSLLAQLPLGAQLSSDYFFAQANTCDKLGDSEGAMQALDQAHAKQMEKACLLAPELLAPDVEPLTIGMQPISSESYRQWPQMSAPTAQQSPIFIMGFPRSGTTLLEQMLDATPGLRAMDEQPFLQKLTQRMQTFGLSYPDDLQQLSASQCDELRELYWSLVRKTVQLELGERLVDKNPPNMLRLPLIYRLFPKASIIFAQRHPCDVVLSCYMQSFGAPAYMILCSTLERLARGYVNAMNGWIHNTATLKPNVLELRHEDLLADFDAMAHAIAEFIGITEITPMRAFNEHARKKGYIATPSYAQVIQPLNNKGVDRWRRYRAHLEPILPILKPIVDRWGYAD
jgi:tetratricopeptide (TPR) repeat protein